MLPYALLWFVNLFLDPTTDIKTQAILNAGLLGDESGNAISDVLFGDINPSGRLPYTIAKSAVDYNGQICPCCECNYTEGMYIDYKHFDQAGIQPRYEFGFGLSK